MNYQMPNYTFARLVSLVRECLRGVEEHPNLIVQARQLKDLIAKFNALRVDHTEYTCLKALVLFKPDLAGLQHHVQVELLQDQTNAMLQEYCLTKEGGNNVNRLRFGRLLLLLPSVAALSGKILEDLFFKKTVGNIAVERVVSDLFYGT